MLLRECPRCRRHVSVRELECPFCDVTLGGSSTSVRVAVAGRLSRAAVFAGATLAGTACWTDANTPRTTPIEHKTVDAKPTPPPPGTIRGVIRNAGTGEPLPGMSLMIALRDGNTVYATSNQQGQYEFTNLPPGEYLVEYELGNPRERPHGIKVTLGGDAGTLADVRVVLPAPDRGPCCKPYGAPPARRRLV
jgi:hypothetical protein